LTVQKEEEVVGENNTGQDDDAEFFCFVFSFFQIYPKTNKRRRSS